MHGARIRHVKRLRVDIHRVLAVDLIGHSLERFGIPRTHCHPATLGGKSLGGRLAQTLAGSRHNRDPVLQSRFHRHRIINAALRKSGGTGGSGGCQTLPHDAGNGSLLRKSFKEVF